MLNDSVLIEVLQSVATRLAKHTEKLKYADKRENVADIATLLVAKDTVKFFQGYGALLRGEARDVLMDIIARLAAHAALWPNDGDLTVLVDAVSFLHSDIDILRQA